MYKIACFLWFLIITHSGGTLLAQSGQSVRDTYQKFEYQIPMRDGVRLYTAVYVPKDASTTNAYPFLMLRTCYGVTPYGPDAYPKQIGPSATLLTDKYIIVYQDVRGRWASEGQWTNMTPIIANQPAQPTQKTPIPVDESTDTYDTIEWLLKTVPHNNGRVGQWGISYPGFYAVAGTVEAHPALKAVSPQAPISDLFFDDFHHNGAFVQAYLFAYPIFGAERPRPTTKPWFAEQFIPSGQKSAFRWQYELGPLKNANRFYQNNFFWQETVAHPNYDRFWQERSVLPHLKAIKPAILTVGGWFDAEDLYGSLQVYKTIEQNNPGLYNTLVMGPFGHGDWSREQGHCLHGDLYFGDSIATFYQRNIEAPFFHHFLKGAGNGNTGLPEAYLFDTGRKAWQTFAQWPAATVQPLPVYLSAQGSLLPQVGNGHHYREFVSDPIAPVPFTADSATLDDFTPLHNYMSADQRFVSQRSDVLTYQTDVLEQDMTLAGEIKGKLQVSTTGTDADWIVKLIDVYPLDEPGHPYMTHSTATLGNYQQLVRSEVMRGRFRNSFEKPEPFTPGAITEINIRLQDILHTVKKGHRLMVQVQSTWFPLIDRNPQKYVDNIFQATANDFQKATHRVYDHSIIELPVLK